jgi:hypothetical protein
VSVKALAQNVLERYGQRYTVGTAAAQGVYQLQQSLVHPGARVWTPNGAGTVAKIDGEWVSVSYPDGKRMRWIISNLVLMA